MQALAHNGWHRESEGQVRCTARKAVISGAGGRRLGWAPRKWLEY